MKKIQEKLQTFAGAMMTPIILLVLVGFYVGIGSAFTNYILTEGTFLHSLFALFTNLGFTFMSHLPVWFAVGISFSLAKKEKGWAAFAGIIMYFSLLSVIETFAGIQGFTAETTTVEALLSTGMPELEALNFNALWGTSEGFSGYDMGIFSGLLAGVIASFIHNKWVDKELPAMFAFFAGTKYVIIMITIFAVPMGLALYYVWPYVGTALQSTANFITNSGLVGTFVFGTLDKLLLPFGLHHLIAFPIEYSAVGGVMEIDGTVYEGVRNIINGQAASATATGYITRNFTTGRVLFQLAGIPGAALAMHRLAKSENKKRVASILFPAVFTLVAVGISEPFEYTFLFVAPLLYFLVYAPLVGLTYVVAEVAQISINGHSLMNMIPNLFQPHKMHAIHLVWLLPLTFAIFYLAFKIVIQRFDLKTPGRGDQKVEDIHLVDKAEYREAQTQRAEGELNEQDLETQIIEALGGAHNIDSITACATRLRVTVNDENDVVSNEIWMEYLDAAGVVRSGNSLQIIYGVHVGTILTKIKDILGMD